MSIGIYMIKNKYTGQMYIGQSNNILRRWSEHCRSKDKGCSYIDNAINKYGKNAFIFLIIEDVSDIALLNEREQYWIKFYNTYLDDFHYNLTPGGESRPLDDKKIYKKFLKKVKSNDFREKMSKVTSGEKNPFYGRTHSSLSKEKMSNTKKKNKTQFGKNNSQAKYTLWNINNCKYLRNDMYNRNRTPNPCKCFKLKHNTYILPIPGFIDFLSCDIISTLIKRFI